MAFPLNGATEVDGQVLVLFRRSTRNVSPCKRLSAVGGGVGGGEGGLEGEGRQVTPSAERLEL